MLSHRLITLFTVFSCLGLHAQQDDSTQIGKFFGGMDLAPISSILLDDDGPDVMLQFKMVSKNPCLRYRLAFHNYTRTNKNLLYFDQGYYRVDREGYSVNVVTNGYNKTTTLGLGLEKVLPMKNFSFILGSDIIAGKRIEGYIDQVLWIQADNDSIIPSYNFEDKVNMRRGSKITTTLIGLAPFAGIELEIGERLSFQTSIRGLLGYNILRDKRMDSYTAGFITPRNKAEAHFTGINLLLYYRF